MKKIRTKIMLCTSVVVLAAVLVTGTVSSIMSYQNTVESVRQTLMEAVEVAASQVRAEIKAYVNIVQEFANNMETLIGRSKEESIARLHKMENDNGFAAVRVVDVNGVDLESGENVSQQAYFQEIKASLKPQVSEPLLTDHSETLIYINVPILSGGKFAGMVMGGIPATRLSEIASSIQIGGGDCTILDKAGNVIAYKDFSQVAEQYNTQILSQTDPSLKGLAAFEAEMIQGKSGFGMYPYEGHQEMMAYAPIPDSNGWSISVAVISSEFLGSTLRSLLFTAAVMVVTLIAAVVLAGVLSNGISRPIVSSAERLASLAEGDLESPVPQFRTQDETGVLSRSLAATAEDLRRIISDITRQLGAMAQGDFTVRSSLDYKGGFQPIQEAMNSIAASLNRTLGKIDRAAAQVSAGAGQVSSAAQALSQGATQQAASVQELAATVNDISGQVSATAQIAGKADQDVEAMGSQMTASNKKMTEMTRAMEEISRKSKEIGNIIKTIEDIAFQTNILALNAAVEAARAGAAGKGFAVVAEEVRNLAGKSAEASKSTTELIESSLNAVAAGSQISDETARFLQQSAEEAVTVTNEIEQISTAAANQATAIAQVTQGIDQISSVVQTNSATAEESAAASEELSSQAQMLKELVGRFKLMEKESPVMS